MQIKNAMNIYRLKSKVYLIVVIIPFLISCPVFGSSVSDVKRVIEKYCKLEWEGVILTNNYSGLQEIMIHPEDQVELLGDGFDIITNYEIINAYVQNDRATVSVKYKIVGQLIGPYRFTENDKVYKVDYTLVNINNSWKIKYTVYPRDKKRGQAHN